MRSPRSNDLRDLPNWETRYLGVFPPMSAPSWLMGTRRRAGSAGSRGLLEGITSYVTGRGLACVALAGVPRKILYIDLDNT